MLSLRLPCLAMLACLAAATARAAPNLPQGDPDLVLLRDAQARGLLPGLPSGALLLGEDEVQRALGVALLGPDPRLLPLGEEGFWLRPLERLTLRGAAFDEHDRPYSLPERPRDLVGAIGVSCELHEGRPCGGGLGLMSELDSAAGLGSWLSASTRVRLNLGNNQYQPALQLDRAYLKAQLGPIALLAGRDAFSLGPSARSGVMVSPNAAPFDQLRATTSFFALPFLDGNILRVRLLDMLARLRQPQLFDGTLLDVERLELLFGNRVQLGGTRFLQLGGEGAPPISFADFVALHFKRQYNANGTQSSNNRLGADLSVAFPELAGGRAYLEVSTEDLRKQEWNVIQYEADYLLGLELRALSLGPWRRFLIEATKTGRLSQEGPQWKTGWTNAGHTLGSPLGPDTLALYLRAEFELPVGRLSPWIELGRFSSDTYKGTGDSAGSIEVAQVGPVEHRQRAGAELDLALRPSLRATVAGYLERVANADLQNGSTRLNAGLLVTLQLTPER